MIQKDFDLLRRRLEAEVALLQVAQLRRHQFSHFFVVSLGFDEFPSFRLVAAEEEEESKIVYFDVGSLS